MVLARSNVDGPWKYTLFKTAHKQSKKLEKSTYSLVMHQKVPVLKLEASYMET